MKLDRAACAAVIALAFSAGAVQAQVKISGSLTATQACAAVQSIRKATNPGAVTLQPGRAYPIIAKNKDEATHYQVLIEGAEPAQRWVEIGCGRTDADPAAAPSAPGAAPAPSAPAPSGRAAGGQRATHLLSMSWEPAFCGQHADKVECAAGAPTNDGTKLALHGLWPQPRGKMYCGADPAAVAADRRHDWASLPEPDMTAQTRQRLAAVMPGVQSGLQRHEWIVHGTCFGTTPDVYFSRASQLGEAVNAGPVRELFARNVGRMLDADQIRAAFDAAYGQGAGQRVVVACSRGPRPIISEVRVFLAGDVAGSAPLADLIAAAQPLPDGGCRSGLVVAPH
jgi:ribonuclease T2